jgi:hypothetical protein
MTAQPYPEGPWPTYEPEGWILDEDRALRDLMKGMVVSDYESGGRTRNVEAWFGHPDQELREQKYPYVTVDLLQIQEGKERVHRGHYFVTDPPAWWGLPALEGDHVCYLLEMPTPVDLDYQIATWARNPRHDRQILQQLITGGRAMLRAGMLQTAEGHFRRLDFLAHVKRDTVESGKRLFNNVFRIRISSEVPWGTVGPNTGLPITDPRVYSTKSVISAIAAQIEGLGKQVDTQALKVAEVLAWYAGVSQRTADILVDGMTVSGVRVARSMLDEAEVGDLVVVSSQALTDDPSGPGDYRFVVLASEH